MTSAPEFAQLGWLDLALGSAACLGLYEVAKKAALRDNAVVLVLLVSSAAAWTLVTAMTIASNFYWLA